MNLNRKPASPETVVASLNGFTPIEDAAPPSSRSRIVWIDYAKGLSIFLVVLGHILIGLKRSEIMSEGLALRIWDAEYYNFRMPFFFLLSGLFADRLASRTAKAFLLDKLATIAYPYFLWSVIQVSIQVLMDRYTNNTMTLADLAWLPLYPVMQFWFIYTLFFVMLAHFVMRKIGIGPAGCLLASLAFYAIQNTVPLGEWWPLMRVQYNLPFYALGCVAGVYGSKIRIHSSSALVLIMILGYGVVVYAASNLIRPPLAVQFAVPLCGMAASIALSVLISRIPAMYVVRTLGRHSLEIFVGHTLAAAATRIVLHKALKIDALMLHAILGTAAGIGFPLILVWLCNRSGIDSLFRLPRPATSPRPRVSLQP